MTCANVSTESVSPVNVIVPCGSRKQDKACPAGEMYTGLYHRACLDYARTRADEAHIFILSAKYGLLRLDAVIEPYERHMSANIRPVANDEFWRMIGEQSTSLKLDGQPLVLLGGADYTGILERCWQMHGWPVEVPLRGCGGLGKQIQWLKQKSLIVPGDNQEAH